MDRLAKIIIGLALITICCGQIMPTVKRCCREGFLNSETKKCQQGDIGAKLGFDIPLNITGVEMPSCKPGFGLRILRNNFYSIEEFSIQQIQDSPEALILDLEHFEFNSEFCIENNPSDADEILAMYCQRQFDCNINPCLRFCCYPGQVMVNDTCVASDDEMPEQDSNVKHFYGIPSNCTHLIEAGKNFTKHDMNEIVETVQNMNLNEYCVMAMPDKTSTLQVCHVQEEVSAFKDFATRAIAIAMIASMFFLTLSFTHVWAYNKEKLFGAMTMNMIAMFFIYFLASITINFAPLTDSQCEGFAYLMQWVYLSAMWWLNSLCFDIWQTFRAIKASTGQQSGHQFGWQHSKFKSYAMWSYGIPALITLVTFCIEKFFNNYAGTLLHPGIGQDSCFLSKEGTLLYIIAPSLPILISNLIFFASTTWKLCCGIWADEQASHLANVINRAHCTTKIFAAAGIAWIAEAISWLIFYFNQDHEEVILQASFALDLFNSLQGLTLFLAIALDKPICTKIKCKIASFFNSQEGDRGDTMTLKEFWNSITGRSVRIYSLDQNHMPIDVVTTSSLDKPMSFRQNSFENC